MKIRNIWPRIGSLAWQLLMLTLLVSARMNAQQFATVKGTVRTDNDVPAADADVHAIDAATGELHSAITKDTGAYEIPHLELNASYHLVACSFPYGQDKTKWKAQKITNGSTIHFTLHTQPQGGGRLQLTLTNAENSDHILWLTEQETQCVIAKFRPSSSTTNKATFDITGWGAGIDVCWRKPDGSVACRSPLIN